MKRLIGLVLTIEAQAEIMEGLAFDMQHDYNLKFIAWSDTADENENQPVELDLLEESAQELRDCEVELSMLFRRLDAIRASHE
tara:strand:+ start:183 stop:431 length:249 start_codon:yes stop_codon:yes gene_type:complete